MVVGWIDKKPIKKHLQYFISRKKSLKQQQQKKGMLKKIVCSMVNNETK